ncbi:type II toxin-antitoxin system VapC family toxin [Sphingomonas citri]
MTFLDSDVPLDLLAPASAFGDWSASQLASATAIGAVAISVVVLAECAGRFADLDSQRGYLDRLGIVVQSLDAAAAFRAGVAHRAYRHAGGPGTAVLADFLIEAQAATTPQSVLITRDRQHFAAYFPDLTLITPETDHG